MIGKPHRDPGLVRMCWFCGTGVWAGKLTKEPDGSFLHANCRGAAEADYPNRLACDAEQTDPKVRRQDQRDYEDDAGAFWA